jgi:hypothetical protein
VTRFVWQAALLVAPTAACRIDENVVELGERPMQAGYERKIDMFNYWRSAKAFIKALSERGASRLSGCGRAWYTGRELEAARLSKRRGLNDCERLNQSLANMLVGKGRRKWWPNEGPEESSERGLSRCGSIKMWTRTIRDG